MTRMRELLLHRRGIYRPLQIILDLVAFTVALLIAFLIRHWLPGYSPAADLSANLISGVWIFAIAWFLSLAYLGGYNPRYVVAGADLYVKVVYSTILAAGLTATGIFLANIPLSRVFFVLFFSVGPMLLIANRVILRRSLNFLRSQGYRRKRVIIAGDMTHIDALAETVRREKWLGYDIVGAITPVGTSQPSSGGIPVLGSMGTIADIVRDEHPDILIFAAGNGLRGQEVRRLAWELEDLDIDTIVVPAVSEVAADRVSMHPVAGLPLVHLQPPRARHALRLSKRVFDFSMSLIGLIVISPLLLIVAAIIKASDGGPVLFVHKRVGRGGELFDFYKFRSMVPDAEKIRAETLENGERDRGNTVMFKMADDPRITKVGKFIRRYSIDELPQLFNVVKGDMSLIGPRPALPSEVDQYDGDAYRRLSVRPGITGLWQVSGRSNLSWEETVRLDLYYVDNWSFAQDLLILARTVRAVFAPEGAY